MSTSTAGAGDWWRNAVVYQIYVRSFADGDGDGTGDIAGIRSQLPYLADLGVDAIWVNPWYTSPLNDGGYDVADYRNIDARYGTVAEAETFIAEAKALGIRVLVDLVPNHTSSEHEWFRAALASPPGSEARRRYHFVDGRGEHGELPPSDWEANFGGPAWTRVPDGQWYLHLFDTTQPDLNWEHPDVRAEFESILRFWLDRGAAGFRVDVAHALVKAPGYPDLGDRWGADGPAWVEGHPFWDRDELHEIVRGWRAVLDEYDDRMMVAEAWVRADRRPAYVRPDEYHQAFDFDFLKASWNAREFAAVIRTGMDEAGAVGSANTWVLSNHDVVRVASRYALPRGTRLNDWLLHGDRDLHDTAAGRRRAEAAMLVMLALPGSVYFYQGDELGLPEAYDLPTDVLDDPVWRNSGHTRKGRDGCRVPMPWSDTGPSLGFGAGDPWLPQPGEYAALAASVQAEDESSTLHLITQGIRLRRERLSPQATVEVTADGDLLRIERSDGVRCLVNMGDEPVELPAGDVLVATSRDATNRLAPNDAVWLS